MDPRTILRPSRHLLALLFCLISVPASAASVTDLMAAAFRGDIGDVRSLLNGGIDVNARDKDRTTALMIAVSRAQVEVVRELLSRGAAVDLQNSYGWTPLMMAVANGETEIQRLLVARGADPALGPSGRNAITLAREKGIRLPVAAVAEAEKDPDEPPVPTVLAPDKRERPLLAKQLDAAYAWFRKRPPDDQRAQAALGAIAEGYARLARLALANARLDETLTYAASGLAVRGDHPGLLAVRQQALLARAEGFLQAGRLARAAESYQESLRLDGGDRSARAGLGRVADAYLGRARDARAKGRTSAALDAVAAGLKLVPGQSDLLALRKDLAAEQQRRLAEQNRIAREKQAREQRRRSIERLLDEAEERVRIGRLTLPEDDNALQRFQRALQLDPNNARARKGLDTLVATYAQWARSALDKNDLDAASRSIQSGLAVRDDDAGLLGLRTQLATATAERDERRAELERLLAAARGAEGADPAQAARLYRQVLKASPDHREAGLGLDRIVEAYRRAAEASQADGDLAGALVQVEQGLALRDDAPALLALRERLQQVRQQREARRLAEEGRLARLEETLVRAERQFLSGQLNRPKGDNALESFRLALEIDPDNRRARQGLARIAQNHRATARRLRGAGQFAEALKAVDDGLQVDGDSAELLSLRQDLRADQAERTRQAAIQEQVRVVAEQRAAAIREGLVDAARQEQAGQLLSPAGDNALESFRRVLELEPDNAKAVAGLDRLVEAQLRIAGERQATGQLADALASVEAGLGIRPESAALTGLRDELLVSIRRRDAQTAEQERLRLAARQRQERLDALLAKAGELLAAGSLSGEGEDNALALYRRVQDMDSANAAARLGISRVAEAYGNRARAALAAGDPQAGLDAVQAGLEAVPVDGGLLSLRRQLVVAKKEEDRRLALQAERKRLIDQGLARARGLRDAGRPGVVEAYREVLTIDADNTEALEALNAIALEALRNADDEQRANRLLAAMKSVDQGLLAAPDNGELLALRDDLGARLRVLEQRQRRDQRRSRQIAVLHTLATEQLGGGRLSLPEGDNALLNFREILALEGDNQAAIEGVSEVVRRLMDPARKNTTEREIAAAISLVAAAGKASPNESPLSKLYAEMEAKLRDYANGYGRIAALFVKADTQFSSGRLTQPDGDNAEETYRAILQLDPDNSRAKEGLARLLGQAKLELQSKLKALREAQRQLNADDEALRLSIQRELSRDREP